MKRIIVFEDSGYRDLYPLTYLRPCFQLRCGAFNLPERLGQYSGRTQVGYWVQEHREKVLAASGRNHRADIKAVGAGPMVLVNARALIPPSLWSRIARTPPNTAFLHQGQLVAAVIQDVLLHRLPGERPEPDCLGALVELCRPLEIKEGLGKYLWDWVNQNSRMIEEDAALFATKNSRLGPGVFLLGKKSRFILGPQSVVEPGVVIDVRQGPVVLGSRTVVRGPSRIEGPCYLGPDCLVDGARLRPGVSLGRGCRISGEVEESVFLEFSNKHHDGFLGHSYVGSWVNLGAGTYNSDLKNNYAAVSVWVGGRMVDTGSLKVGCFIGDHVKTAIGTLIYTGAVIGPGCNVFGGVVRKMLPPFSWGSSQGFREHALDKMMETAQAAMARRGQRLGPEQRAALEQVFKDTQYLRGIDKGGAV